MILAGGAAGIRRVDEIVEERLGLRSFVANPFSRMSVAPRVNAQELMREAPAMMIAVGLALRAFD